MNLVLISAIQIFISFQNQLASSSPAAPNLHESITRDAPLDFLVSQLDQPGVDVNQRDDEQRTPLMRAASLNRLDMIKALRGYHADLSLTDKKGRSALHHSVLGIVLPVDISPVDPEVQMILQRLDDDSENFMTFDELQKRRELVRYLVQSETTSINALSREDETPLTLAAGFGFSELVKELLNKGADVNRAGPIGVSALHLACSNLRPKTAEILLEAGANKDAISQNGFTPLLQCANAVPPFIKTSTDPAYARRQEFANAVIELLLKRKAYLDARGGSKGRGAIHLFAEKGYVERVKALVEAGAKVNLQSYDERLPICCAIEAGQLNVVDYFANLPAQQWESNKENTLSCSPLQCAAAKGLDFEIPKFLDRGASLTSMGDEGTAIHYAVLSGRWNVIDVLLKEGADVNAKNRKGKTALHLAVEVDHPEVIQTLISNYADPNLEDPAGATPLVMAIQLKNQSAIDALLPWARVDVNRGRYQYESALHLGASQANVDIVKSLIERGAKIDARGQEDSTPLIRASIANSLEIVKFLVSKGADIALADRQGMTARDWALKLGHSEIVEFFDSL